MNRGSGAATRVPRRRWLAHMWPKKGGNIFKMDESPVQTNAVTKWIPHTVYRNTEIFAFDIFGSGMKWARSESPCAKGITAQGVINSTVHGKRPRGHDFHSELYTAISARRLRDICRKSFVYPINDAKYVSTEPVALIWPVDS